MSSLTHLRGKLFNVATNESPPYLSLDSENHLIGGIEAKLLFKMNQYFNFSYKIINCNYDWGILLPNKSWTGIIGKIVNKEADFGLSTITVTNERSEAVYFSNPHIISSLSFMTSPPKTEPNLTLVVDPFDSLVWIFVIIAFILMFFNSWIISRTLTEIKNFDINWEIITVSLRQQMCSDLPPFFHLRILFSCWLLACFVLTTSYSGCLYTLMVFPSHIKTIDTINELSIAQINGEIEVTAVINTNYYESLKNAKLGIFKEIGKLLKPVQNANMAINKLKSSTKAYAFITTREQLIYSMLENGPQNFYLPPDSDESTFSLDIMAIAMHKEFKFKKQFNKFISNIINGGFLEYWRITEYRKLFKNDLKNLNFTPEVKQQYDRLYLYQLQSSIYLYIFANLISLIFLFLFIEFFL